MWIAISIFILVYIVAAVWLSKPIREIVQSKNIPVSNEIEIPYYLLAYLCGGALNVTFSILYRLNREKILTFSNDFKTIEEIKKVTSLSDFEKEFCKAISSNSNVSSIFDKNALTHLKSGIENDSFFKQYPQFIFTEAERTIRSTNMYYHTAVVGVLALLGFLNLRGPEFCLLIPLGISWLIVHTTFFTFPKNPDVADGVKNYQQAMNPKLMSDTVTLPLQQQLTQVALYGPAVFAVLGWSAFAELYVRKDSGSISGGSGCGSSCSGSSCGSNCGGGSSDGGSSCGGGCGGCGGGGGD